MSMDQLRHDVPRNTIVDLFAETASRLYASEDVEETLQRVTSAMVAVIGPCDAASVSLLTDKQIVTRAATDPVTARIDAIQYETGEGPCLAAAPPSGSSTSRTRRTTSAGPGSRGGAPTRSAWSARSPTGSSPGATRPRHWGP
jgi:hypothetical protein